VLQEPKHALLRNRIPSDFTANMGKSQSVYEI
jgi:hypothetical protein